MVPLMSTMSPIKKRFLVLGAAWTLVLAGVAAAWAIVVTPIHIEMTAVGAGSRAQITVANNNSTAPLPIEVVIQSMTMNEKGERTLTKAGDDFLVLPPQALIAPGATQVFRIQWVGDPQLAQSKSYLMFMNQIPVKMPAKANAVQVVMSFGVVVNVAPAQGTPELKLVGTGIETDKKTGKRHPTITVENPTRVHALLPQSALKVSGGSWSHTFTRTEMDEKIGIGLVLPGKRRRFVLAVDLPAGVSTVQATLDFRPKR